MRTLARGLLVCTLSFGCTTSDGDAGDEAGDTSGSTTSGSESSGGGSTTGDASSSTGGDENGEDSSSGTTTGAITPSFGEPDVLPTPDGVCPAFETGTLDFEPGETGPRQARVWYDPETGGGGPIVFYWHGTGSSPLEAEYGLGNAAIDDILARGGMVVAPVSDPEAGQFPWFLVLGTEEDDVHLMDEIVGCAAEGPGIDPSRIHAIGMSAGGLQTSQVSVRRSSYIASVVVYSGGLFTSELPNDDPDRPFPAMIYHGGPEDIVVVSFQQASERYKQYIDDLGGYALICDHGGGHVIPDSRVYSWQFLLDHPFDIAPFPYQGQIPDWVPDICVE